MAEPTKKERKKRSLLFLCNISDIACFGSKRSKQQSCSSVGKVVASNSRDLQLESSHRQILFTIICIINCFEMTKIKKKETVNGPILKEQNCLSRFSVDLNKLSLTCGVAERHLAMA